MTFCGSKQLNRTFLLSSLTWPWLQWNYRQYIAGALCNVPVQHIDHGFILHRQTDECVKDVDVSVNKSRGVELESESPESQFWAGVWVSVWKETLTPALSVLSGLMCSFVAVYLTSVQFFLQLKLCLYTIFYLLLGELKIFLKSTVSAQALCHTISPRVGLGVQVFYGRSCILES